MKRIVLTTLGLLAVMGCEGRGTIVQAPPEKVVAETPARGMYVLPPEGLVTEAAASPKSRANAAGAHVLFINFDGAPLRSGQCSNSVQNCSFIVECAGTAMYPAYSGNNRQQVVDMVKGWLSAYNVTVVTERPASGDYTMCMVGGTPNSVCNQQAAAAGAAGVAPLDCNNMLGENDVVFAFTDVVQNDTLAVAATIAQESAHGWGLEHTNEMTDVMYPYLTSVTNGFLDRSMPIVAAPGDNGSRCRPGQATQNSHQLMLTALGAGGPDTQPPAVHFTSPMNGATVQPTFTLQVMATDNQTLTKVELIADPGTSGEQHAMATAPPFQWMVTNYASGAHTFKVIATDAASLTAEDQIMITVAGGSGGGQAGSGTAGTGGSGGGAAGGGTGGTSGGGGRSGGGGPVTGGESMDLGNPCMGDGQCDTRRCILPAGGTMGFCSVSCAADTDCGANESITCIKAGGTGLCTPNGFNVDGTKKPAAEGGCAAANGQATFAPLALLALALFGRRRRTVGGNR